VETWHPRFSYYGFRYIQVEGAVLKGQKNPFRLPVIQKIQSCFVYNSAPKISTFECSNRIFNDAHRLIEKAELILLRNKRGFHRKSPLRVFGKTKIN
jgi:alpha-L-rhamnosidase